MEDDLGRISKWLVGPTVTLFVAVMGLSATADDAQKYLTLLWIIVAIVGIVWLLVTLGYMLLLARRHWEPIQFYGDIRCQYITNAKQLQVRCWFKDRSKRGASYSSVECDVIVRLNRIVMNQGKRVGGTYISGSSISTGIPERIMAEFWQDVSIEHVPSSVGVWILIGLNSRLYRAVQFYSKVPLQVI